MVRGKNIKILVNKKYMTAFFKSRLTNFFPRAKKIISLEIQHLRALAKSSYLIIYKLNLLLKNNRKERITLRGNKSSIKVYQIMGHFNKISVCPKPLYYFQDLNFLLYQEFSGQVLRDFERKEKILFSCIPKIANCLAKIHSFSPFSIPRQTLGAEEEYLKQLKTRISKNAPFLKKQALKMLDKIEFYEKNFFDGKKFTLTHGDFQPSNIIYNLKRKKVGIIDFHDSCLFNPTSDVADFLVHLATMLNPYHSPKKIVNLKTLFLKEYLKKVRQEIALTVIRELELYQARAALDIVAITVVSIKNSQNPWRKFLPKLLTNLAKKDMGNFEKKFKKGLNKINQVSVKNIKFTCLKQIKL